MAQEIGILVDSSVWIDYYRRSGTPQEALLDHAMDRHPILVPNIVLLEVLRGISNERTARLVEEEFQNYVCFDIDGTNIHVSAAKNYRVLRGLGITVRNSIDILIGTWCIEAGVPLLHDDRDFDGMEKHLGLVVWRGERA